MQEPGGIAPLPEHGMGVRLLRVAEARPQGQRRLKFFLGVRGPAQMSEPDAEAQMRLPAGGLRTGQPPPVEDGREPPAGPLALDRPGSVPGWGLIEEGLVPFRLPRPR